MNLTVLKLAKFKYHIDLPLLMAGHNTPKQSGRILSLEEVKAIFEDPMKPSTRGGFCTPDDCPEGLIHFDQSLLEIPTDSFHAALGIYFDLDQAIRGGELITGLLKKRIDLLNLTEYDGRCIHDNIFAVHCQTVDATPMSERIWCQPHDVMIAYSASLNPLMPSSMDVVDILFNIIKNSFRVALAIDFVDEGMSFAIIHFDGTESKEKVAKFIDDLKAEGMDTLKAVVQRSRTSEFEYLAFDFDQL